MSAILSGGDLNDPHTDTIIIPPRPGSAPETGWDSVILLLPERGSGVPPSRNNPVLSMQLYTFAKAQAEDIGERLHSAEFWVTDLPEVVEQRAKAHDCEDCQNAVANALGVMRERPGTWVAVGILHWTDPRRAMATQN